MHVVKCCLCSYCGGVCRAMGWLPHCGIVTMPWDGCHAMYEMVAMLCMCVARWYETFNDL